MAMNSSPVEVPSLPTRWIDARARIFGTAALVDAPFRDRGWRLAIVQDSLAMAAEGFTAVRELAALAADTHVGVCGHQEEFDSQPEVVMPVRAHAFRELSDRTVLGHIKVRIFGLSAAWGLIVSPEDYVLIGSAPSLHARLDVVLGDHETRQAAFRRSLLRGEVGDGEHTRAYFDALLRLVDESQG